MGIPHQYAEVFLNKLRRRLREAFADVDVEQFDLTTLRHSFASRCRDGLEHTEAAALLGHTGRRTTGAYGKRYKRWNKGSSGDTGGWMPTPDQKMVETLKLEFQSAPEDLPGNNLEIASPGDS